MCQLAHTSKVRQDNLPPLQRATHHKLVLRSLTCRRNHKALNGRRYQVSYVKSVDAFGLSFWPHARHFPPTWFDIVFSVCARCWGEENYVPVHYLLLWRPRALPGALAFVCVIVMIDRGPTASFAPPIVHAKGTDFYMTSLNAQALIDEWNNGMNLVEILEIMVPQVCNDCFTSVLFWPVTSSFSSGRAVLTSSPDKARCAAIALLRCSKAVSTLDGLTAKKLTALFHPILSCSLFCRCPRTETWSLSSRTT